MYATNTQSITDERTGKTYIVHVSDPAFTIESLEKLKERADFDYIESLPADKRADRKVKPTDFTCPHCMGSHEVSSRKEKISSGFLFFWSTHLIDIYKCPCGREFKEEELRRKRFDVERSNTVVRNFERWRDMKAKGLNPPEFMSLDKVDKYLITEESVKLLS
jgi:hypothetical protein